MTTNAATRLGPSGASGIQCISKARALLGARLLSKGSIPSRENQRSTPRARKDLTFRDHLQHRTKARALLRRSSWKNPKARALPGSCRATIGQGQNSKMYLIAKAIGWPGAFSGLGRKIERCLGGPRASPENFSPGLRPRTPESPNDQMIKSPNHGPRRTQRTRRPACFLA